MARAGFANLLESIGNGSGIAKLIGTGALGMAIGASWASGGTEPKAQPAAASRVDEDASRPVGPVGVDEVRESMKRIDSTAWYKISRKARGAWHNALRGRGMVQDLELYVSRDESNNEVAGVYAIGCSLCGHPQIVVSQRDATPARCGDAM